MAIAIGRVSYQLSDVLFVLLLLACLVFSAAAIVSGLEARQAALVQGGARKVDAAKIRKQILDGHLSPTKALFYRRLPR